MVSFCAFWVVLFTV